jgi:transposase
MDASFSALYKAEGRHSIPPERLLRATLLQMLYTVRSERQLVERLEFDLLFLQASPLARRLRQA